MDPRSPSNGLGMAIDKTLRVGLGFGLWDFVISPQVYCLMFGDFYSFHDVLKIPPHLSSDSTLVGTYLTLAAFAAYIPLRRVLVGKSGLEDIG